MARAHRTIPPTSDRASDALVKKQMKIAKPELYYKLYAWGVLVLYLSLLRFCIDELRRGQITEHVVGMSLVAGVLCFCLYAIIRTHGVYRWDDEEIRYTTLFGTRSTRWNEIVRYRVRRFAGGFKRIVLNDGWGNRLTVHSYLLAEQSPLLQVVNEKLAALQQADMQEIEKSGEAQFPLGIRDLPLGLFIVRGDTLIHKRGRKTSEIPLVEVQRVVQSTEYGEDGEPASEVATLTTSDGITIQIPSETKGYDRLISYIRAHTKNAVWISAGAPEPMPASAKTEYRRRLFRTTYERHFAMLAAILFAIGIACTVIPMLVQNDPSARGRFTFVVETVMFAIFAVVTVILLVRYMRGIRRLRDKPGTVRSQEEKRTESRTNR